MKRKNRGGVRRTRAEEEEVNRPIYQRSFHYTTKGYTIKQHNVAVSRQPLCFCFQRCCKPQRNHSSLPPPCGREELLVRLLRPSSLSSPPNQQVCEGRSTSRSLRLVSFSAESRQESLKCLSQSGASLAVSSDYSNGTKDLQLGIREYQQFGKMWLMGQKRKQHLIGCSRAPPTGHS